MILVLGATSAYAAAGLGGDCVGTIQEAIDAATPGDTIVVEPGVHIVPEGLLVDGKSLDFVMGYCSPFPGPGTRAVIDFNGGNGRWEINAATVTIQGFDIVNGVNPGIFGGLLHLADSGLLVPAAHVTLTDVTVNHGDQHDAGCVYVGDGATLDAVDSTIGPDCIADAWAGAIQVRGGELNLWGTTTVSGTAFGQAGAVRVWAGDEVTPTIFAGRMAMYDNAEVLTSSAPHGGGVVVDGDGVLELWDNSSIHDCDATGDGGGVELVDGTLSVADAATIRDNTSTGNGAGIFAAPGTTVTFAGSSSLAGNNADGGGAGMCVDGATATFADAASIKDNHSGLGGGGVDIIGGGTLDLSDDVLVELNDAGGDGGAIRVGEGTLGLADRVSITDNDALAGNGGAIALGVTGAATLIMRGEPFFDPEVDPLLEPAGFAQGGVRLTANSASAAGGAIWVGALGRIGLPAVDAVPAERARFAILASNAAGVQGGGMYLSAGAIARVENMRIAANEAQEAAGVYVGQGATFELASRQTGGAGFACVADPGADFHWADRSCAEVSDNQATSGVGGISVNADALTTLSRVRMSGNGGGPTSAAHVLISGDGVASMDNVVLHDATGGNYAVLVQDVGTLSARHSTFADSGKHAVWEDASVGTLTDTVFWGSPVGGLEIWGFAAVRGRCNAGHGDIDLVTWSGGGPSLNADEEDPLFITNTWGRFHLDDLSPSADACPTGVAIDLDGRSRPRNVKGLPVPYYDRGAFEATE